LLPEDLRSSIVKNHGRRQINEYADDLLTAVAFWREIGAWRSKLRKKASSAPTQSVAAVSTAISERNVIALAERRRASVVPTVRDLESESGYALERPMTAAR
jgi:hypothetical protein